MCPSSPATSPRRGGADRTGNWRHPPASCPARHRGRAGSRRRAGCGWSFPNGCACRDYLRDRRECPRCSARRGLPIRPAAPPAADCRRTIRHWSGRTAARDRVSHGSPPSASSSPP
ncbi:Hypothetical protein GbCGDNIH7_8379 [Granulibacter bethesdensis]|nr:Hypothetical protein GbCGDNIH7_8379 [Granulibacter bethesdensis]